MATQFSIRRTYREILHFVKQKSDHLASLNELRSSFRKPLGDDETAESRLKAAESRLSFLKMSSVKMRPRGDSGRWIYKEGERLVDENGTLRDSRGRVVSNWDGNNLDPESVTRHRKQLKRMGFANNAHAKGFF